MHEQTTPQKGPGEASNVIPFPSRNGAPKPESEHARKREVRARLKAAHRRTACRLGVILDPPQSGSNLPGNFRATLRRHVSRLANLVGARRDELNVSETYTRAMLALYARQASGEDVRAAARIAWNIGNYTKPSRLADALTVSEASALLEARRSLAFAGARRSAPGAAGPAVESEPERTRRELLDQLRRGGEFEDAACSKRFPLGAFILSNDRLAGYNIRKEDVLRFTLDGDAEHGELAVVTYYAGNRRHCYVAFLAVEGDHFCLRSTSHLTCGSVHREPEFLTIIGRVVRVERAGLPVRLKGLELRGLPFADEVKEERTA